MLTRPGSHYQINPVTYICTHGQRLMITMGKKQEKRAKRKADVHDGGRILIQGSPLRYARVHPPSIPLWHP